MHVDQADPSERQQQEQESGSFEHRPLLDHRRGDHRPFQPPGPPEMVGEGMGVHVRQPEHA
jgi:hypothetical protein